MGAHESRLSAITTIQLELQRVLHKRIQQLLHLKTELKAKRRKTKNQQIFSEFLDSILHDCRALARKNREVTSVEEVREYERELEKLFWFSPDILEEAPAAAAAEAAGDQKDDHE